MSAHRAAALAARIAEAADWTWSRASGPGGQRRDHAETRAELTVRAEHLDEIAPRTRARLVAGLRLDERPLRMTAQAERSRERNRQAVIARLERRVAAALAPAPPPRRPTRPSRAARERRLAEKAHRGRIKVERRTPGEE